MPSAWGAESSARQELFDLAWGYACVEDYICIMDADMTPARSPRVLMDTKADAILFPLYDLWHQDEARLWYRDDGFWAAHRHPRPWMIRKDADMDASRFMWSKRGIHPGHLPLNFSPARVAYAPMDYGILHYAYVDEDRRASKYEAYAQVAHTLTDHELKHARSIMDPKPHLEELSFRPEILLA
jgi:hypothetical protein